ncbi:cellulose binding domain-containing protein [Actinocorallia sp. A-T 12471]|uniref:cellulose binding domain-containing protein n=1 Tax=Actinocorallia sp. A-T 12471 TaxID=3089813 RepID=UPI0029CE4496|nr:cellulose binding domain-containing protein [Actinocorallia sp. A-T 12471]MDX6739030.1 cellulose binding domain-containing protein [Actinocorallia sp. A-T 12471]
MGGEKERATRGDLPLPGRARVRRDRPRDDVPVAVAAAKAKEELEETVVDGVQGDPSEWTVVDKPVRQRDVPVAGKGVGETTVVDDDDTGPLALPLLPPPRPEPDVVFGPVVGADDETGPQPPLPVLMELLGRAPTAGDGATRGDMRVHPPISPILAEALHKPPKPKGKVGLVIPGVIVSGLLVIGVVAALIWPEASRRPQSAPASGAAPTSAAPSAQPSDGVLSGVTPDGVGVVYETVEVATGYFEGTLTLTNGTGSVIPSWTVTFTYPGAYIRNVWGGRLTDPGNDVTIVSDAATSPIQPGASVEIRFGGGGSPSRPQDCAFGGTPCGF